jgi:hypothetical protein
MLGCGTLVVSDASEEGKSILHDVPHVDKLQLLITDLIFDRAAGSDSPGARHGDIEGTSPLDAQSAAGHSVQPRRW